MIEMLATLLIVIAAPKGEMRMQFYIPTMEQCKQVEPALVQHFSRFGRIVEHGCWPYKDERRAWASAPHPKRDAHSLQERCDLICPDLPKVL
jgi:hypothetical protein